MHSDNYECAFEVYRDNEEQTRDECERNCTKKTRLRGATDRQGDKGCTAIRWIFRSNEREISANIFRVKKHGS